MCEPVDIIDGAAEDPRPSSRARAGARRLLLASGPDRAVRAGRVLIVTNNHWMTDPGHWHGGLLHTDSNNALLLNLAALAATQDWRDACM